MLATAACRAAGETLGTETKRHIRLDNLSRTTLPVDIERALGRLRVVGVEDIQLELFRFLPTRRAYVTLTHPDFLQRTLAKLKDAVIGGHRITPVPSLEPLAIENLRGAKGRKAFIERQPPPGAISSGAMSNGKQVCLWGFPPKTSVECVKNFLEESEIDTLGDQPEICKVHFARILPLLKIPGPDFIHIKLVPFGSTDSPNLFQARKAWFKIPVNMASNKSMPRTLQTRA